MGKIRVNSGIVSLLILAAVLLYLIARKGSFSVTLITVLFLAFYLLIVIKPKKIYG